jgi:hypothetical protein
MWAWHQGMEHPHHVCPTATGLWAAFTPLWAQQLSSPAALHCALYTVVTWYSCQRRAQALSRPTLWQGHIHTPAGCGHQGAQGVGAPHTGGTCPDCIQWYASLLMLLLCNHTPTCPVTTAAPVPSWRQHPCRPDGSQAVAPLPTPGRARVGTLHNAGARC